MTITIRPAVNGWIVTRKDDEVTEAYAYSHNLETDTLDVQAFASMLRDITDWIGPDTSRYSPARVRVFVEPGDKYEPPK